VGFFVGIVVVAAYGGSVFATPIVGVTSIPLAKGQFDEIDAKTLSSKWQARIDTERRSISAPGTCRAPTARCASCG
jgi:hypothetical protein